jgi:hypothetical protein
VKAKTALERLYKFFVGFGIFIFIGTLVELSMLNHTREELQIVPFVLLPLGIVVALLMLVKTNPVVQRVLLVFMWVVAVGGLIGMGVHVFSNLESVFEGGQQLAFGQFLRTALGGRNPFLAPGTLTIGAAMILAVFYAKQMVEGKNK